ncbi:hypothetical protein D3C71_845890 [compost metagenome]
MRFFGIDDDTHPVERVVGRVGLDQRRHAGASIQCLFPEVEIAGLALTDAGMVALFPGFQRRHDAVNALLADLHAAANAHILQEGVAHQFFLAGHDA